MDRRLICEIGADKIWGGSMDPPKYIGSVNVYICSDKELGIPGVRAKFQADLVLFFASAVSFNFEPVPMISNFENHRRLMPNSLDYFPSMEISMTVEIDLERGCFLEDGHELLKVMNAHEVFEMIRSRIESL